MLFIFFSGFKQISKLLCFQQMNHHILYISRKEDIIAYIVFIGHFYLPAWLQGSHSELLVEKTHQQLS
jgi:hypothetical protein